MASGAARAGAMVAQGLPDMYTFTRSLGSVQNEGSS